MTPELLEFSSETTPQTDLDDMVAQMHVREEREAHHRDLYAHTKYIGQASRTWFACTPNGDVTQVTETRPIIYPPKAKTG